MEGLHGRIRVAWAIRGIVVAAVLAAVAYGITTVVEIPQRIPVVVGIFVVVSLVGLWHALARYRRWRFDLESDALTLQRGVLTQVDTAVPYVRVQHVDTQRGPLDRLLGLSTVVVYTAGSRGADVAVPGLTEERAEQLLDELRELAVDAEPDDAV
jgi:membrane protein YdbS with pleckstrin-like domain